MQFEVLADPDATVGISRQEAWMDRPIAPGRSYPLGARLRDDRVNFSVFSKYSTGVELCLFDHVDDARPARLIALDPRTHRTYHYWHVFVPGVAPGQLYARCRSYCAIGRSNRHRVKLNSPDWSDHSHILAASSALLWDQFLLHVIVNAYWEPLEFEPPPLAETYEPWRRCIDTFLASPEDVCQLEDGPIVPTTTYRVQPRSLVVLFAKERTDAQQPTPAGGKQP
jgi:pullulanase/glycogen debranching enzyme